jgi:NitT/TauT family transport system permease protein
MPIAVLVYPTWDKAIIFLITMASIWPLILSAAAGREKDRTKLVRGRSQPWCK